MEREGNKKIQMRYEYVQTLHDTLHSNHYYCKHASKKLRQKLPLSTLLTSANYFLFYLSGI